MKVTFSFALSGRKKRNKKRELLVSKGVTALEPKNFFCFSDLALTLL